ncbi:hypothetical protein [Halobaculum sp. D14]|uniref:hypothetical protein n=1 Tax=unclassified Halobaculum TaxID=2640896 RepID=UPI003EB9D539
MSAPLDAVVGMQASLLVIIAFLTGAVSYWVYRDADARGVENAPFWGATVGVLFLFGAVVGGLLALGIYLAHRPDEPVPERDVAAELDAAGDLAVDAAAEATSVAGDAVVAAGAAVESAGDAVTAAADRGSNDGSGSGDSDGDDDSGGPAA